MMIEKVILGTPKYDETSLTNKKRSRELKMESIFLLKWLMPGDYGSMV